MKHVAIAFVFAVAGALLAGFAGYFMVLQLSSNTHDRALEAAMTAVFVFAPAGGLLSFVAGLIWSRRRSVPPPA